MCLRVEPSNSERGIQYGANSRRGSICSLTVFFFQAEDGIRDLTVTGVQTCALPICALFVGIGRALRRRSPGTLRIGVVPKEAPAMALSFEAGRAVESDRSATFADGQIGRASCRERV